VRAPDDMGVLPFRIIGFNDEFEEYRTSLNSSPLYGFLYPYLCFAEHFVRNPRFDDTNELAEAKFYSYFIGNIEEVYENHNHYSGRGTKQEVFKNLLSGELPPAADDQFLWEPYDELIDQKTKNFLDENCLYLINSDYNENINYASFWDIGKEYNGEDQE
jgi:hypothetical protein